VDALSLVLEVTVLTAAGVLSPGPLTFATVAEGAKGGWRAGLRVALGHMAVELPLLVLLALGLAPLLESPSVGKLLSTVGGVALVLYALLTLKAAISLRSQELPESSAEGRGALAAGVAFTLFNPHFLLWWATAGAKLVSDAVTALGGVVLGLAALYAAHVWMDFAWLSVIAYMGSRGAKASPRVLAVVLALLSVAMGYYGVSFLAAGIGFISG